MQRPTPENLADRCFTCSILNMKKQICLVTGSSRGLGAQTCVSLSSLGFHVVITGRDVTQIKSLAKQIKDEQPDASLEVFQLDVTNPKMIKDLRDHIDLKYGRLDLLINNAGILPSGQIDFLSTDTSTFLETLQVNTMAPIRLSQSFIPLLLKSPNPQIINISSGMGSLQDMKSGYPAYRLSKTGLNCVTRMLHSEFYPKGLRTNSICPGWVRTDMGGLDASRSLEQGVQGILFLAQTPKDGPSGKFFRDQTEISF